MSRKNNEFDSSSNSVNKNCNKVFQVWNDIIWWFSLFILFASPMSLQFLSSWNSIPSKSILHHGLWIGSCQNVLSASSDKKVLLCFFVNKYIFLLSYFVIESAKWLSWIFPNRLNWGKGQDFKSEFQDYLTVLLGRYNLLFHSHLTFFQAKLTNYLFGQISSNNFGQIYFDKWSVILKPWLLTMTVFLFF